MKWTQINSYNFVQHTANDINHQDKAQVKIYIISDNNRIVFEFKNTKQMVLDEKEYVSQ